MSNIQKDIYVLLESVCNMKRTTNTDRPFLRWAGGKTWLTDFVLSLTKDLEINRYYEPFLGGGAVFFAIKPQNAILSDVNAELIPTYITLRQRPEEVISVLKTFQNESESYYRVRSDVRDDDVYMCARFIFLNQTSYNGLYRVNMAGQYNVPFGRRKIDFIKEDHLRHVSQLLQGADLRCGDFGTYEQEIQAGDLVFLDPPYTVSHNQNGFIKYNQHLFSLDDQYRLKGFIDHIKGRGAYYILTNAAHDTIREIFDDGDVMYTRNRHSTIGGNQAQRGHVDEYVFTNIAARCEYGLD